MYIFKRKKSKYQNQN
jgi:alkylation response protein AidB-like acyl-CoA dehydrogenase